MVIQGPEPLSPKIRRDSFRSGNAALDEWFSRHALGAHRTASTKVFVTSSEDAVALGFYALSAGGVAPSLGAQPVPVGLVTRLVVSEEVRGLGLGRALLKDALLRLDVASEHLGIRAVLAHATDDAARAFYRRFDFEPSPIDPLWMLLGMDDLRRNLPASRS